MSAWALVLAEVAARGGTAPQLARRLELPEALVGSIIAHAQRLGVVAMAGGGCGSGCPTGPDAPAACAGCPLAPRPHRGRP